MKSIRITSLVIGLALLVTACGEKKTEQAQEENKGTNVQVLKLEQTTVARNLSFSVVLQAYEKVAIAPNIPGRISNILVKVGSQVSAGQLLVQMDKSNYEQAKVQFDNLAVDYNRVKQLNASDNISKQQYDQTKASYEATKTKVDDLQANTFLRAPFAGVIEAKNYENGELFNGAQPILSLVQINNLKAFVSIPETYYSQLKEGTKVAITSDIYPNQTFEGVIEIIYPTIDPITHTFQIQIKIPNADKTLRPGMYASTSISFGNVKTTVVPYQAVLKLQGSNDRYVFVNNNGVAKRIAVQLGQRFDDKTEIITEEIHDGDELVVVGQAKLVDGAPLIIQKEESK
ncbi:MAG: efflux RND transporter periplasmic adaptor subunit [Bacteroidales bacterium]|jgi:RND family efflux transporter MFP subunit|nr:efflux RND transporter periplasmic adaptor subunit [Bacteroidales bacterium]